MKRKYILGMLAAATLGAGIVATQENRPSYIEDFCSIYNGSSDDSFQKAICDSASSRKQLQDKTISQIRRFFSCPFDNAKNYAEKQRTVYTKLEDYLEEDQTENTIITNILTKTIEQEGKIEDIKNSIDDLYQTHKLIDSRTDLLDDYEIMKNNLVENLRNGSYKESSNGIKKYIIWTLYKIGF